MKRTRIVGLCLVAVMAVSAMAVASASAALPEFVTAHFPVSFSSKNVLPLEPTLHSSVLGGSNVSCLMSVDNGEVTGPMSVAKVQVSYVGCKEEGTANACTTTGAATGTIITEVIDGLIGYVTGGLTAKAVGTELLPEKLIGGKPIFAEFTCTGAANKVIVEGCTIGQATPINTLQLTGNLIFEELAGGGQKYQSIDGGHNQPCKQTVTASVLKLKGEGWLMDNELETFSAAVELKA